MCSVLSNDSVLTWDLFFFLLLRTASDDDAFAHCMILVLCSIVRFKTLRKFFKISLFEFAKGIIFFINIPLKSYIWEISFQRFRVLGECLVCFLVWFVVQCIAVLESLGSLLLNWRFLSPCLCVRYYISFISLAVFVPFSLSVPLFLSLNCEVAPASIFSTPCPLWKIIL